MANTNVLYVKALPAAEVVGALTQFSEAILTDDPVDVVVSTNLPGIALNVRAQGRDIPGNNKVREFLATWANRPHVLTPQASVINSNNGNMRLDYTCEDGLIGQLKLNMSGDIQRAPKSLDLLEKLFNLTGYVDLVREVSPVIDQAAITARERSVADLQGAVQKLVDFQATLTIREADSRRALQEKMDATYQERLDSLEKEYRERQGKLDAKKSEDEEAIKRKELAFETKVAYYDLNEPKAKRRELLERIDKVLKEAEATTLSGPTAKKRANVHRTCAGLISVGGALITFALIMIIARPNADWHYFAVLASGVLMFASTMVYYLKWNDRWFREHADAEFAAKRYKADILRASWVAELVQEAVASGKGEMPEDVIAAYTRNLFRDIGTSRVSEHPMDDITGLIKGARRIDIGKGIFSLRTGADHRPS